VEPGSKVLAPGFTFSAVPSAILLRGAVPVFVESTEDYRIDLVDLESKIAPDTKVLLLSHMRGYAPDMDAVVALCAKHDITLIEDAAHALGGRWCGRALGSFGKIGCYSFQSNKIVNAGEGGVLVTDDEEAIVKAIYLSGAYDSNYRKHGISSTLFESFRNRLPLDNARMTNLTAAIARPQIALIDAKGERFRQMHAYLRRELAATHQIVFPRDHPVELRIPDSIQFRLRNFTSNAVKTFLAYIRDRGIPITGFGERDNARAFFNWQYLDVPHLPQTGRILADSCDLRLSSNLTEEHLCYLVSALRDAVLEAQAS
jgi:dTDP-4-amino-4,6-dideoxygalactose transaminase